MDPTEPEHALRGVVSAAAAAVGLQRRRAGQRHLEDDRRRQDVDEAHRQRPADQPDHRPHRPRLQPLEAEHHLRVDRSRRRAAAPAPASTTTARSCRRAGTRRRRWRWRRRRRPRRQRTTARSDQERRLAIGRRRQDVGVPRATTTIARCTTARSASIRPTPRSSTRPARARFKIARRRQDVQAFDALGSGPATAITTRSGSTRATASTSSSATTAASTSATTRARPGKS